MGRPVVVVFLLAVPSVRVETFDLKRSQTPPSPGRCVISEPGPTLEVLSVVFFGRINSHRAWEPEKQKLEAVLWLSQGQVQSWGMDGTGLLIPASSGLDLPR